MRWLTACLAGLPLLSSGASAQPPHPHEHDHPDVVILDDSGSQRLRRSLSADSARADRPGRVSTTPDNQILVELAPEDTTPANLFDLNGRTLVFTPDGHGGYSRSVRSVAWEEDIGQPIADGAEIPLESFMFDFAGQSWGSFFVSQHGLITFGGSFIHDGSFRWPTMHEIAGQFVTSPTISPLFKPFYDASQHVSRRPDQVVVTWVATEPRFYVHGVAPGRPARFQVVLGADGSVRFSYRDVTFGDGIVGLFANENEQVTKTDLIVSIADPRDPELPGHVDLLDVAIYETNTDAVILEFTLRDDIPNPPDGERYTYRVHFDMDEPFWSHPVDWSDEDFAWLVDVRPGGERSVHAHQRGSLQLLPSGAGNKIAVLAHMGRDDPVTSVAAFGAAGRWRDDTAVQHKNTRVADFDLIARREEVDLSRSDSVFSSRQSEVFHYQGVPEDLTQIVACRVIETLGDEFDLFVFHNEFRIDSQESSSPWSGIANVTGIGDPGGRPRTHPCSGGRLKGHWTQSVWIKSIYVVNDGHDWRYRDEWGRFDRALFLFIHEFTHAWTAYASYLRNGEREPLVIDDCHCHWRPELHLPAAFPWNEEYVGPQSVMGGRFWRENGDGTFTPFDGVRAGGPAWLDLYMMGLAEASEVPDMFILRNLKPVNEGDRWGPHTGDKEIVSIEQIVAAEGPREPASASAQKDFNAAFVYLLEPGRTPDPEMLRLHAEYRDKVIEHWSHVTGRRSQLTTTVPGVANRSPVAVGRLADQVVPVEGVVVVDVVGAFRDPDGDPLTYEATSSAPAVASVEVSGSTVTVRAVSAGIAAVTVTATDISGSNTKATLAFRVAVGGVPLTTFSDDPILPGVTPVKAVHFTELRERIDLLRDGAGLAPFVWTDPVLSAGVTPVRLSHLLELRVALGAAYRAAGRAGPVFTDAAPMEGTTPIRAVHLTELRAAVVALE